VVASVTPQRALPPAQPALPEVPGVRHYWVVAHGLELHVAEAGDPTSPPLLLLHGWPQHWYEWRKLVPELAERFRLVMPDLPGFGWSEVPAHGYEKETLAGDILALLDRLGLESDVGLVGHDWGGWIGFLLCLRAPERFRGYLALNITHPWQRFELRKLPAFARFWYQLAVAAPHVGAAVIRDGRLVRRLLVRDLHHRDALTSGDLDAYLDVLAVPERARASSLLYRTFLARELWPIVRGRYRDARLELPVTLLFGTGDGFIATDLLGGFERNAPRMRLELVPDSGHFIAEEKPELVAAHVGRLFGG
jgi:pimeloyl-ACP methyl ester carboxylesterase